MTKPLQYVWEITPKQLFASFKPVKDSKVSVTVGTPRPFDAVDAYPLEGTPFEYQLGLGADSLLPDLKPIREACPDLVIEKEHRSGIIVLSGDTNVIASFTVGGTKHSVRTVFVAEEYRGKGLGTRMVSEWYRQVPRIPIYPQQVVTLYTANTLLGAHEDAVLWAETSGKTVPDNVRDAVTAGEERRAILAAFAKLGK